MHKRVVTELSEEQLLSCKSIAEKASAPADEQCLKVDIKRNTALSKNEKGYVQIKVRGHSNHNKKVQLHQLVAWMHPDSKKQALLREAILSGKKEISHLCKQKVCMNPDHLVPESSATNKSRNNCTTIIRINDKVFPCCKHSPQCIPTAQDYEEILSYTV